MRISLTQDAQEALRVGALEAFKWLSGNIPYSPQNEDKFRELKRRIEDPEGYVRERRTILEAHRRHKNEVKQNTKKYWVPKIEAWAIKNLKPGMFVRFSGTRDGSGLREIAGPVNRAAGDVPAYQLSTYRAKVDPVSRVNHASPYNNGRRIKLGDYSGINVHGLSKLTHILTVDPSTGAFTEKTIKSIIGDK